MPVPNSPTTAEQTFWTNVWWSTSRWGLYYCDCVGRGPRDCGGCHANCPGESCPDSRALYQPSWEQFLRGRSWYSHGHDGKWYEYSSFRPNDMWNDFNAAFNCNGVGTPNVSLQPISNKQTFDPPFALSASSPATSPAINFESNNTNVATINGSIVTLGKFGGQVTITASQTSECYPTSFASTSFTVFGITSLPAMGNAEWGTVLSDAPLIGGSANLSGSFQWANPNIIISEQFTGYGIKFVPDNPSFGPYFSTIPAYPKIKIDPIVPDFRQTIDSPFFLNIRKNYNDPITVTSLNPASAEVFGNRVELRNRGGLVTIVASQPSRGIQDSISFTVYGITSLPVASGLKYGQRLEESIITGGGANLPGTFRWVNPNLITNVGTSSYLVEFVPTDTNFGPYRESIPVTTNNKMTMALTNPDKIGSILASGNSGPTTQLVNAPGHPNLTPNLKGILHLASDEYKNINYIDAKYLGIKDVHFFNRKPYQDDVFTGITPSGLSYLDLTSNALTTEAIDGILISMLENAKKFKINTGQIYLWGGSSGWNSFPSEKGHSARTQLILPPSPKFSGIFSLSGATGSQTGVTFFLNGIGNSLFLTGTTISGNILSIVNKSPPFSDGVSTYSVTPLTENRCLFTRNLEGLADGSFNFIISGSSTIGLGPVSGEFSILGSGGKYYGNWRVGINRWVEAFEGRNVLGGNEAMAQSQRNATKSNINRALQFYDINLNYSVGRFLARLKPNQTINFALINYATRGVSNLSFGSLVRVYFATSSFSGPIATFNLGPGNVFQTNARLGQRAYGHSVGYTSQNEVYRYSGCPVHGVTCSSETLFGGPTTASLITPYPFDGNTVECPITCFKNIHGADVVLYLDGPAPAFSPPAVFIDDSLAYNIYTYPEEFTCAYQQTIDPDQGKVCTERSIPRDHAIII